MRIGHFSDVHLLSLKGSSWVDFLSKRWIGGLNLLTNRARHHRPEIFDAMVEDFNARDIDHLVATGDITNVALESEFSFAREKFDRIELGSKEVTVIPGNHDAYVEKGREHFEAAFGAYFESDDDWRQQATWPCVRVRGDVAIIGLSTSLQTPWFTCYGVLGDSQIERLEAILSDKRLESKFRLVAIHHPPAGHWAARSKRGLRDHAEFAAVLSRVGAELVLHGHEHEDISNELPGPDGPIGVRCIQSGTYCASSHEHLARYRVYEVERTEGAQRPSVVSESVRRWDPATSGFVDDFASDLGSDLGSETKAESAKQPENSAQVAEPA